MKSGYIIIEGNIGVGKSTFARALAGAFERAGEKARYLPEPDETSNPFLAGYYDDPKANAYKMQMHLLHQRFKATQYAQKAAKFGEGWFIMDRSYFGDLCFADVQIKRGFFTQAEYKSYLDAHRNMREFIEYPTAAIFLKAKPAVCKERIETRDRQCERGVKLSYLKALQTEINRLEKRMATRCPVQSLDWNADKTSAELCAAADELVKAIHMMDSITGPWDF